MKGVNQCLRRSDLTNKSGRYAAPLDLSGEPIRSRRLRLAAHWTGLCVQASNEIAGTRFFTFTLFSLSVQEMKSKMRRLLRFPLAVMMILVVLCLAGCNSGPTPVPTVIAPLATGEQPATLPLPSPTHTPVQPTLAPTQTSVQATAAPSGQPGAPGCPLGAAVA